MGALARPKALSEDDNVRQGFFEAGEFDAVTVALDDDDVRDFVRFLYLSSWRRGEAATLTWADVDLAGGVIRLRAEHAKTGHARFLALDDDLRALLTRRWQARTITGPDGTTRVADLVFHRDGESVGCFRKAWATACVKAGLFHVVTDPDGTERKVPARLVHDLRRTAVRDMIRAGVRPDIAMKISGHRTQSMLGRYNISTEEDVREAVARTAEYRAARPRAAKVISLATAAQGAAR